MRDPQTVYVLRTRAWVLYTIQTFFRSIEIVSNRGGWFGEQKFCTKEVTEDCIGQYNKDFMDPLTPLMGNCMRTVNFLTLIVCIVCFKKRELADLFFPIECIMRIMAVFHLNYSSYAYEYVDYGWVYSVNIFMFS
mmetsp:Transcript_10678/g.13251  ORF Transcript_10678/g.13251 Transcript_10678/m.13251 type:complete len:135 (-) Transcript_10678:2547-2951(-)